MEHANVDFVFDLFYLVRVLRLTHSILFLFLLLGGVSLYAYAKFVNPLLGH